MSFPTVINLNDYLHGYDNIKGKQYEKEVERMQTYAAKQVESNLKTEQVKLDKLAEKPTLPEKPKSERVEKQVNICVTDEPMAESQPEPLEKITEFRESKRVDYGKLPEVIEEDDQDYYANLARELQLELGSDDSYTVKHTNEKFVIQKPQSLPTSED